MNIPTLRQSTNTLVMVSPDTFQFNQETAASNAFQNENLGSETVVTQQALKEFNEMVVKLRSHQIQVLVLPSRKDTPTPDAVFPNNWFSTHITRDGQRVLILYPMMAKNRRHERQPTALQTLLNLNYITINETIDLTTLEYEECFLEGTGSMILDHINKVAYAAISPRTDAKAVEIFCEKMKYEPVIFNCFDILGKPIYHTNVVMSVGTQFAILAAETITDIKEREKVLSKLQETNKHPILITTSQMQQMAGNILEVCSVDNKKHIVMSQTASNAFSSEQQEEIKKFGKPIIVNIDTIEKLGGGSARCMLAEIF